MLVKSLFIGEWYFLRGTFPYSQIKVDDRIEVKTKVSFRLVYVAKP